MSVLTCSFVAYTLPQFVGIFILGFIISGLYSSVLKGWIPAIATPLWSLAVVWLAVGSSPVRIIEFTVIFLVFFGRELLLDLRDIDADGRWCKHKSMPAYLGIWTVPSVILMQILAAVLCFTSIQNNALGVFILSVVWLTTLLAWGGSNQHLKIEPKLAAQLALIQTIMFPALLLF